MPQPAPSRSALTLFSAGQDSTVSLAWALARFDRVETIGFDYGQRHRIELTQRPRVLAALKARFPSWADKLGPDRVVDLTSFGALADSALTGAGPITTRADGLPTTFVPGRNLAFFVYAAAYAAGRGLGRLVGGMCETDYSGYPDCRRDALDALEGALRLGMASEVAIDTPLMRLTKADTWALAAGLGGAALVEIVRDETHTCYRGIRDQRHDWGYGCGDCPACNLRAEGYAAWRAAGAPSLDPNARA